MDVKEEIVKAFLGQVDSYARLYPVVNDGKVEHYVNINELEDFIKDALEEALG